MNEPTLFDAEQHVTRDHIKAIYHVHRLDHCIYTAEDLEKAITESHRLAQFDLNACAQHLADHSINVFVSELGGDDPASSAAMGRNEFIDLLMPWLENPDLIPKLYRVPTFGDCVRLADVKTEAGRALAWLMGIWPETHPHAPGVAVMGASEDVGDKWVFLLGDAVSFHERLDRHPYAVKTHFRIDGATSGQMVATARYLLAKAKGA